MIIEVQPLDEINITVTVSPEPSIEVINSTAAINVTVATVGTQGVPGPQGPPGADGFFPPKGPAFTYTSGILTRIDYDDLSYKTFTYVSGKLAQIDYVKGAVTERRVFNYTGDVLTSIDDITL